MYRVRAHRWGALKMKRATPAWLFQKFQFAPNQTRQILHFGALGACRSWNIAAGFTLQARHIRTSDIDNQSC